jgi:hypothetical protein
MKADIQLISPQIAEEYLKRNRKNRKISEKQVKRLAREMANGRWSLNGEPIQFNSDGDLINGQHRLSAIVLSGVSVYILVVMGITDPNAFATIDQNSLGRGAYTVLQMKGVAHANQITSITKKLLHWHNSKDKTQFSFSTNEWYDASSSDVVEFYENNEYLISFIFNLVKDSRMIKSCSARSAIITALIICYETNPVTTLKFIDKFKTGIELKQDSPILLLREKLMIGVAPKDGGRNWNLEVMAITIKAFNTFSEGKTRKLLRWSPNEKFPVPIAEYRTC